MIFKFGNFAHTVGLSAILATNGLCCSLWFSVACFCGVRVSVMFHLMFVHYTFSSVWVAE